MQTTVSPQYEQGVRVINVVGSNETKAAMPVIDYKLVDDMLVLNPDQVKVARNKTDLFISLPGGDSDRPDVMIADYYPTHSDNLLAGMSASDLSLSSEKNLPSSVLDGDAKASAATQQTTDSAMTTTHQTVASVEKNLPSSVLDELSAAAENHSSGAQLAQEVNQLNDAPMTSPYANSGATSEGVSGAWWVLPLGILGAAYAIHEHNKDDDADNDSSASNSDTTRAAKVATVGEETVTGDVLASDNVNLGNVLESKTATAETLSTQATTGDYAYASDTGMLSSLLQDGLVA